MFRYSRHWSIVIAVALIVSFLFAFPTAFIQAATKTKLASSEAPTSAELKAAYQEAAAGGDRVRILIVPGHEPTYGGAQYAGYYERELVLMLSEKLATELRADPNLEVLVARDMTGWNDDLAPYFKRNMKTIKKFVETHKKEMKKLLKRGKVEKNEEQAGHNVAPGDVAYRLYGITKWSNENDVDLMIHVHLNDAGDRTASGVGKYSGLAIYVPDSQFGNGDVSKDIAEDVFDKVTKLTAKSTLPIEDKGVVEDQELIALGANSTSAVASILIEYGYIYEPKFIDENIRTTVFTDYALQTARGVHDFFGGNASGTYETKALPHTWRSDVVAALEPQPYALANPEQSPTSAAVTPEPVSSIAIYALQHALKAEGYYPAAPSTLINCPLDGRMGECVTDALRAYQKARGIKESGTLDATTRNILNARYSLVPVIATTDPVTLVPAPTTVSSSCAAFTGSLELESTDAKTKGQVTRLQKILAQDKTIYPEGKVTGYFGPATDKAVKAFQVKNKIAAAGSAGYGIVGPMTAKALLAVCK
ncbi:MAG: peptidoglycan-binding protein [Patescibacteria group bacterium]